MLAIMEGADAEVIDMEIVERLVGDDLVELKDMINEQLLNKYLILHCAKLHLTVTDASSGEYLPASKQKA